MRLGRLPHSPAAVSAAPSLAGHRFAATLPPAKVDRRAIPFAPGMYQNDSLPDCTAAGLANAAGMVAALNGYQLTVDPTLVPPFYAACVGWLRRLRPRWPRPTALSCWTFLAAPGHASASASGQQELVGLFGTLPSREAIASAVASCWVMRISVATRCTKPIWTCV